MLRLCVAICLYFLVSAGLAHAQTVSLRPRIEASGPAVTMGDVFSGVSSDIAGRALAPAPQPGQVGSLQMSVLSAAASAAGLDFTPPPGVLAVQMIRPGGARATLPATSGGRTIADAAVRRGDFVNLVYEMPGMSLNMRARALEDGAVGQGIRLVNTSSNRTIDAIVTGPGAARANP
ncbi:MAG: flagellar basal body P-ring formation chaperone FlgA [Alphaproteobacteria bacterium]|nr:flagellar basal body P-ring formation chaperone FlgA [Alphaproteobacteria bacterium]